MYYEIVIRAISDELKVSARKSSNNFSASCLSLIHILWQYKNVPWLLKKLQLFGDFSENVLISFLRKKYYSINYSAILYICPCQKFFHDKLCKIITVGVHQRSPFSLCSCQTSFITAVDPVDTSHQRRSLQ